MKVGLDGIGEYNLIAMRFGIAFIAMSLMFLPRFGHLTLPTLAKGLVMGVILFLIFYGMVNGVNLTDCLDGGFSDEYDRRHRAGSAKPDRQNTPLAQYRHRHSDFHYRTFFADGKRRYIA